MTHVESQSHRVVGFQHLLQRAFASRYFMYALLVHMAILAVLGGWIVAKYPAPLSDFVGTWLPPEQPLSAPTPPRPPSEADPSERETVPSPPMLPSQVPGRPLNVLALNGPSGRSLPSLAGPKSTPWDGMPAGVAEAGVPAGINQPAGLSDAQRKRYARIEKFFESMAVSGSRTQTRAIFTCYLGKYADGDWNCNPTALENMLTQVVRWSKDRIKASVQPKAIDLASDEIYQTHPPFLFLTGHKDFHFTDKEVGNLREYLLIGGAVWADNSLPGRHSRFDEAFRREMKRVLPDREFEPVPRNHDVFNAFFHLREIPSGMNGYQEAIEQIKMDGELVVIYTQNAYSDLWETALDEQNKIDTDIYLDEDTGQTYRKFGPHYGNYLTGFLYRNVNDASIVEANRLALNIVVHLLTRYQDKIMMVGNSAR